VTTAFTSTGVAIDAAVDALELYAAAPAEIRRAARPDPGPALLACAASAYPQAAAGAQAALLVWLRDSGRARHHPGLFEIGLAGHWLALRSAAAVWPQLDGVATAAGAALRRLVAGAPWSGHAGGLGWPHYDLISGPAGTALAGTALAGTALAGTALDGTALDGTALDAHWLTGPAVRHLASLCRHSDLRDLVVRQYAGERSRGWNTGRVNTGLAHGVAGVVAALAAAGTEPDALHTAASWLARQAAVTTDGLVGWPVGVGATSTPVSTGHRLSWCYGTPGVSWALWRAGQALGDGALREFALHAFGTWVARFDAERQLRGLGLCCGAAGVALICDAVHRATGRPDAAALRTHLLDRIHAGLGAVVAAAAQGCGLLSGPGGTLAGLLALSCPGQGRPGQHQPARRWLPAIGLLS